MLTTHSLAELDTLISKLNFECGLDEKLNILTTKVAVNPTLPRRSEELNFFRFRGKQLKLMEKLFLGIILWYCPPEIRILGFLELERVWGEEKREWLATLTTSKLFALGTLLEQDKYNDNDLEGNFFKEEYFRALIQKLPNSLRKRNSKARELVRRRGHRDSAAGWKVYKGPNKIKFSELITEEELVQQQVELELRTHYFLRQVESRVFNELYGT